MHINLCLCKFVSVCVEDNILNNIVIRELFSNTPQEIGLEIQRECLLFVAKMTIIKPKSEKGKNRKAKGEKKGRK